VAGGDCTSGYKIFCAGPNDSRRMNTLQQHGSDRARWNGEAAFLVYDWCFDVLTTQQRIEHLKHIRGNRRGLEQLPHGHQSTEVGGPAMMQDQLQHREYAQTTSSPASARMGRYFGGHGS